MSTQGCIESAELVGDGLVMPLAKLPAFLRLLLTTDGTVTKSLEAYFWETVEIADLVQTLGVDQSTNGVLAAPQLFRKVNLVGSHSKRRYARAESTVAINDLPPHLADDLLAGQIGIGELVRASGLSSFRQILAVGLHSTPLGLEIWRRYAIYVHEQPAIQITEWFPLAIYC